MQYPQINFKRYTNHSNSTETYTEHNPKTTTTAFSVPVAPHTGPLRKDGGAGNPTIHLIVDYYVIGRQKALFPTQPIIN